MISHKLRLPFTPISFVNWIHGWGFIDLKYIEQFGVLSRYKNLVGTIAEERFFKAKGIDAIAVGVPFVYAKDYDGVHTNRKMNSLLVMPPHGLPYTTEKWDEEDYVNEIVQLKGDFDLIVACIHPSCVSKGAWTGVFNKHGIPWISGAEMHDKYALVRMHRIFQSFEFMTTNCIGSHVAYAAYSGCKVSIYGRFAEFGKEDVKDDVLYMTYPFVMEHNLENSTKQSIYRKFPFLFVHPTKALECVNWASDQLGEGNKISYYQLAVQLGWLPHQQMYHWTRKIYFKLYKEVSKLFKK